MEIVIYSIVSVSGVAAPKLKSFGRYHFLYKKLITPDRSTTMIRFEEKTH